MIARVQKGCVLLDMRTVPRDFDADLLDALRKVCHDLGDAGRGERPGAEDSEGRRTGGAVPWRASGEA